MHSVPQIHDAQRTNVPCLVWKRVEGCLETHHSAAEGEGQTQPHVPDLPVLISWTPQVLWRCIFCCVGLLLIKVSVINGIGLFFSPPPPLFSSSQLYFQPYCERDYRLLWGWESRRSLPGSACPRAWQSPSSCCSNETAALHLIIFCMVASNKNMTLLGVASNCTAKINF